MLTVSHIIICHIQPILQTCYIDILLVKVPLKKTLCHRTVVSESSSYGNDLNGLKTTSTVYLQQIVMVSL